MQAASTSALNSRSCAVADWTPSAAHRAWQLCTAAPAVLARAGAAAPARHVAELKVMHRYLKTPTATSAVQTQLRLLCCLLRRWLSALAAEQLHLGFDGVDRQPQLLAVCLQEVQQPLKPHWQQARRAHVMCIEQRRHRAKG